VQAFLLTIDRINAWIGKTFAWCIVILTVVVCYEIFVRTALRSPTTWIFDASYMLYGTLFMMAGAYTLSRNGHVRGDFLYRKFAPRNQAALDLVLYFLFFFPAILAFMWTGWDFFVQSYLTNEHSTNSPAGPIIWPFKGLIPVVGVLLLVQGFAEVIRCVTCLRTGEWPHRLHDVEEMEKLILERAEAEKSTGAGPERR
jgi:TRAP-type mannitol/chloroaromatic compound transport system permease small subunit